MEFFNFYNHGFVRLAVGIPVVRIADPAANAERTIELLKEAAARRVALAAFPELGLCGYSCEDLFAQSALLRAAREALLRVREASAGLPVVAVVGLPLELDGALYNCAAVVHRGRILGVVPKTYLPNYREFYELRQFASGECAHEREILLGGETVPFGSRLLFAASDEPLFAFAVEICEDLWVPIPPSCYAALAGATVLVNLSASNITVGKEEYRRELVGNQSARCLAAYVYTAAGWGESTTDLAWDGHGMIYENGTRLVETERFLDRDQLVTAEVDLERLAADRRRQGSFTQCRLQHLAQIEVFRSISFRAELARDGVLLLARRYDRFPYVPSDLRKNEERCREIYRIQVQGLATRLQAAGLQKAVLGISGGLDSTQALLVACRAMDQLRLPRSNVLAYTMPAFGTSERTLAQAHRLMKALGCTAHQIDIRPSCRQMLRDIGHPAAQGAAVYDTTFENVQAGERTSHLFRLANANGALVVGTSDLSELALGWCTYGVGDQMAHYHVNASVPKTLIRHLIASEAEREALGEETSALLREILATEISPELIPGRTDGQPAQRTEDVVGPFSLQDFHLYYILRFGYEPAKVAFLAWTAWHDCTQGEWPRGEPRAQYSIAEIKKWLRLFLRRFFAESQFKRSCIANAPKVGTGGSLSPRGDYRAPSDSPATVWLAACDAIPEREPSSSCLD
ncbi:NAD(+) synthase [Methylacidimicrobium sp. AP8]|uniref:NAD(+) synthase n=1 Tax=Methylacidimicrobium sp. AP8 TaxID=2730359 RepID=UPI001923B64D|nr:NAD(+) synthase [Methylacidimicrobium sp. AP8]